MKLNHFMAYIQMDTKKNISINLDYYEDLPQILKCLLEDFKNIIQLIKFY